MSKELEALERIINAFESGLPIHTKDIKIIETALKDYEELKKLKLLPYPKVNDEEYRRGVIKRLQALESIKKKTNLTKTNDDQKALVFVILETEEEFDLLKEVLF